MNSESSFKFSETKYSAPHRFNQLFWPPKNLSKKTSQGNHILAGHRPRHPSLATFSTCHGHLPPNLPGEIRPAFSFPELCSLGHGKDACSPMSLVWSLLIFWLRFRKKIAAILYLSITESSCETVKPWLKRRYWLERRLQFLIPTVTPLKMFNMEPQKSPLPSLRFFQIEISIGWFTRLSKSTKNCLTPWPFSPVVSPPLSSPQNTPHQQAHHPIQWWSARNGTTSIRRDEGDGLAYQTPPMAWLTPKTAGFLFGDFVFFSKTAFFRKWWGEKKKNSLNLGIFIINP